MQIARDLLKRETVRVGERDHDVVFSRGRLQLEIELAAQPFAKRKPPGTIDPAAIGRMHDELHAACLIEKPFQNDIVLRRQATERSMAGSKVFNQLLGRSRYRRAVVGANATPRVRKDRAAAAQPRSCATGTPIAT